MTATSPSRFWSITWLILAVVVIPFGLAALLFDVNQFEIGVLFALGGLLVWIIAHGAGWRPVGKDQVVIVKDAMDGVSAHPRGSYLFIPIVNKVEAVLPAYPVTFEFPIEAIDTHTDGLTKISQICVRATCQITSPEMFYRKSRAYIDRIGQLEETRKLKRTDIALWRELMQELVDVYVDDTVRDVVWRWKADFLTRDDVVRALDYAPEKDGKPNLAGDPYSLSRNRKILAEEVKAAVKSRLDHNQVGIRIDPLVFEAITVDGEIIKRATSDRGKEIEKAKHDAAVLAEAMLKKGEAEATVRAETLAKLLDVLINKHEIPRTDPLIGEVVRAALYSDGKKLWEVLSDQGQSPNGAPKAS